MKETSESKKGGDLMRKILSDDEVRYISRGVRKVVRPILEEVLRYGLSIEDTVRFGAVGHRLREAREARGTDLKATAKALRVPQYRLRYIEQCSVKSLRASDLHAYIEFLGLSKWFARWSRANAKLAARLAVNTERG